MAKRDPNSKVVGNTEECFSHLYANRTRDERLALHRLLAGFCDIRPEAVSQWTRSRHSVRGSSLVGLRCFLHLAGYEVTEVDGYQEPVRSLLLIVGLKVIEDPHDLERRLGYMDSNLKSLYRIILRNERYSPEVGEMIGEICKKSEDKTGEEGAR